MYSREGPAHAMVMGRMCGDWIPMQGGSSQEAAIMPLLNLQGVQGPLRRILLANAKHFRVAVREHSLRIGMGPLQNGPFQFDGQWHKSVTWASTMQRGAVGYQCSKQTEDRLIVDVVPPGDEVASIQWILAFDPESDVCTISFAKGEDTLQMRLRRTTPLQVRSDSEGGIAVGVEDHVDLDVLLRGGGNSRHSQRSLGSLGRLPEAHEEAQEAAATGAAAPTDGGSTGSAGSDDPSGERAAAWGSADRVVGCFVCGGGAVSAPAAGGARRRGGVEEPEALAGEASRSPSPEAAAAPGGGGGTSQGPGQGRFAYVPEARKVGRAAAAAAGGGISWEEGGGAAGESPWRVHQTSSSSSSRTSSGSLSSPGSLASSGRSTSAGGGDSSRSSRSGAGGAGGRDERVSRRAAGGKKGSQDAPGSSSGSVGLMGRLRQKIADM